MRGPFGSLIAQAQQKCLKKRFPHRFLPSSGALDLLHAACQFTQERCGIPKIALFR
jgi:hypothetical protein